MLGEHIRRKLANKCCPDCAVVDPLSQTLDLSGCTARIIREIELARDDDDGNDDGNDGNDKDNGNGNDDNGNDDDSNDNASDEDEDGGLLAWLPCAISVSIPLGCSGSIERDVDFPIAATANFATVNIGGAVTWDFGIVDGVFLIAAQGFASLPVSEWAYRIATGARHWLRLASTSVSQVKRSVAPRLMARFLLS